MASFTFRPLYSGESVAEVSWLSKTRSLTLKISLPFYRLTPQYKLHAFLTGHTHHYSLNERLREPKGRSGGGGYDTDPCMCQG